MRRATLLIGLTAAFPAIAAGQTVTIEGEVYHGIEGGCWMLDDIHTSSTFNLYGGGDDLYREGVWAIITGTPRPDMITYCMQGTPFEINDYRIRDPWYWPPEECAIEPEEATTDDNVTITVGGQWPDSCAPVEMVAAVENQTVYLDIFGHGVAAQCFHVITPWSLSVTVGPLPEGAYEVLVSYHSDPQIDSEPVELCGFVVTGGQCEPVPIEVYPPSCAIDARQPTDTDGSNRSGWDAFEITFDSNAECLGLEDFEVLGYDDSFPSPTVEAVITNGNTAMVELSGPIPLSRWTCIRYLGTDDVFCWGHQPADVSGNRWSCPSDILYLIDCLNGVRSCEPWQCDVDRSGMCGPPDILRVIDLLNGAAAYKPWLYHHLLCRCPAG